MIPLYVLAGLFGSLIGSFLNVVIYRLPRGMPMGMERSKCPKCSNQIAWYDNIPLLSWLVLRARCRACSATIPIRYPAVELLTAVVFILCLDRTLALEWSPLAFGFLVAAAFSSVVISLAFIDLDLGILPDSLTVRTLLPLGAVGAVVVPAIHGTALLGHDLAQGIKPGLASLIVGAISGAVAFGIMLGVGSLGRRGAPPEPASEEVVGPKHGEAKFAAGIGVLLGLEPTLYALGIALVLASLVGALRFLLTSQRRLPLGPFLGAGALSALFFADLLAETVGLL